MTRPFGSSVALAWSLGPERGFVADHVEVLHDVDIEAQGRAREIGIRLERPPSLNDDPLFILALADAVRSEARAAGFLPA